MADARVEDAYADRVGARVFLDQAERFLRDARTAGLSTESQTVLLHNAGTSTSGDSEQHIEIGGVRYSHIVDPATGLGMTNRIQATIIAPDATTTDSLDTTVCLLGIKRGLALVESFPRTAALIFTRKNGEEKSFASRRFKHIRQLRPLDSGLRAQDSGL